MKKTAVNPYLPSWEYVPDGEPHVFENRLYVYGSHDRAHGTTYCEEDYVGWSAPLSDLGDWKYEGVIYRKDQDGDNPEGKKLMFAPDAAQGPDGRYYLYYGLSDVEYIGVAVSGSPAGPFEYYGRVAYGDGSIPEGLAFDPGILAEEDGIYLYYGFSHKVDDKTKRHFEIMNKHIMPGAYMVKLDRDMKTVVSRPVLIANGYSSAKGTSFEEHPFFEASSIRKIRGRYYFVYSSLQGHELCYAVSDSPAGPFDFGGVIVSNGDIGLGEGQTAYDANNHGGIAEVMGQYYIFYHRHTHGTHFSRQGCAEKIQILEDGSIPQVEITSCGLNDGPLSAKTQYPAYIICNLHGPKPACHIPSKPPYDETVPYLWETGEAERKQRKLYLKNLQKNAACGVKYLEFSEVTEITVTVKGASGQIYVCLDDEKNSPAAVIHVGDTSEEWQSCTAPAVISDGIHAVCFRFEPDVDSMDMLDFRFS